MSTGTPAMRAAASCGNTSGRRCRRRPRRGGRRGSRSLQRERRQTCSEMSSMRTSRPAAFCVSHLRLGSAAVQRNRSLVEPRHRAIVDHLAALVAPRRVVDLSDARAPSASRVMMRSTAAAASRPVSEVLEERRDVDERRGVADGVVFVLVVRFVRADRVVAGPLAIVEALAQRETSARGRRFQSA